MSTTAKATNHDTTLDSDDVKVVAGAERALDAGVELKRWWEEVDAADAYRNKFKEAFVHSRPDDHSFGFFETADLASGETKVIGNVQQQLYHRPKTGTAQFIQDQIREFVLRYFMRISDYRTPQPVPEGEPASGPLKYLSRYPSADDYELQGFGYSQRYYKERDSGVVRRFTAADQNAIVDQREFNDKYAWTLVRNPIVDFEINLRPLGLNGPDLKLPIPEAANWLVMSSDTVTIDEDPGDGWLGRYGIGYAFMKEPGRPGLFAYGPGQLEPTVQTLIWQVRENGDVIVRMSFVSAAPEAILNVSVNPLEWGFEAFDLFTARQFSGYLAPFRRAANLLPFSDRVFDPVYPAVRALDLLTMGISRRQLGISREQINKTLTYVHFLQHYNAVLGSQQTWEMFPDWTDESKLPDWVTTGNST